MARSPFLPCSASGRLRTSESLRQLLARGLNRDTRGRLDCSHTEPGRRGIRAATRGNVRLAVPGLARRGLRRPPPREWLARYASEFPTVEVNNAFYRLPERSVFERWRDETPPGFVVAVKVSRYLTHVKRLRDPCEPVQRLTGRAAGLGDRLGPYLLQLPPTLRADAGLLDDCLRPSRSARVAVEPRHETWWRADVRAVLESCGAALCWADRWGRPVTPCGSRPTGATSGCTRAGVAAAVLRAGGAGEVARPHRGPGPARHGRVRLLQQRPRRGRGAQRPHAPAPGGTP